MQQPLEWCWVLQADPGVPLSRGCPQALMWGSGAERGGAGARPMRCVGFPAVLVMNLHEASVSTRRQSMAESTGVNKRWIMRAEGSACRLSWGPGGQRLINAEWHRRPPPSPALCPWPWGALVSPTPPAKLGGCPSPPPPTCPPGSRANFRQVLMKLLVWKSILRALTSAVAVLGAGEPWSGWEGGMG